MNFGKRLKELRAAAGLTQAALAERSGVGKGTIRDIEQGAKQRPLFDTVVALAAALGVDCTAFTEAAKKPPKRPRQGRRTQ